jgi:O-acetyl-ADP-ribose deacetylase (regulator of RNase III)
MIVLRKENKLPEGQMLEVRQGDLTQEEVDAIVNAANSHLAHGGGVAGAIVRRGGYTIQEESDGWVAEHGPVPTGQVAVTGAGRLACKWVIHAVGPVWQGGEAHEEELLAAAVMNSLLKAEEMKLQSISLPAISSGIFGFPKERCAEIMITTAEGFCREHPRSSLRRICFTNIDEQTVRIFEAKIEHL